MDKHLLQTYKRFPVTFTHGQRCFLYDDCGNEYVDFLAGIAVNTLGYNHPKLSKVIAEQTSKLLHISNFFYTEPMVELSKKLAELFPSDMAIFFGNSGSEANECAIKMARAYGCKGKDYRYKIIVFESGFHGRTYGSLSGTPQPEKWRYFGPMLPGFISIPFNDAAALTKAAEDPQVIGIWLEVIQGEGGINVADASFIGTLNKLCKENDILMMCDEVQSGIGRTGSWWGFDRFQIEPDIVTSAKGLASGVPIGAALAKTHVAKCMDYGSHGSTFGGNPLAAAAANCTLDVIRDEGLLENVSLQRANIERLLDPNLFSAIRGHGLMLGLEINSALFEGRDIAATTRELVQKLLLENHLVLNGVRPGILRLLPPLIISDDEITEGIRRLQTGMREFFNCHD